MPRMNYKKAEERLRFWADTIEVQPPARLLSDDGAPSRELLNFCRQYGASLDWIFCGDVRSMIRARYTVAKMEQGAKA